MAHPRETVLKVTPFWLSGPLLRAAIEWEVLAVGAGLGNRPKPLGPGFASYLHPPWLVMVCKLSLSAPQFLVCKMG